MSFISLFFVWFFPTVVVGYYILPNKYRNIFLLLASYFAYWRWNGSIVLLLVYITLVSFIGAKVIKKNKGLFVLDLIITLIPLFFYKYTALLINTFNGGNKIDWPFILPVGISFFTFQALSYEIDVYRGDVQEEKNIIKYALFISFFPQLVAGPIEKSKTFLAQFDEEHKFNENNIVKGFLLILWGFFIKMCIADRLAAVVDELFNNVDNYAGFYLWAGAIFFLLQVFCDFAGYTTIALGAARALGFTLTDNFQTPFLSRSVAEYWRRWHISLSSWFAEYVYFPLGGNRKGKARKYLNLLIVFGLSGMWHGAEWSFLIWGLLNAIYQIIGDFLKGIRCKTKKWLRINENTLGYKIWATLFTFLIIAFSHIFFRASDIEHALFYIKKMCVWNPWVLFDESILSIGLDSQDFRLLLFFLCILLLSEIAKYKKICISDIVMKQDIIVRYTIYVFAIVFMFIFAYYGENSSNFIYFAF